MQRQQVAVTFVTILPGWLVYMHNTVMTRTGEYPTASPKQSKIQVLTGVLCGVQVLSSYDKYPEEAGNVMSTQQQVRKQIKNSLSWFSTPGTSARV